VPISATPEPGQLIDLAEAMETLSAERARRAAHAAPETGGALQEGPMQRPWSTTRWVALGLALIVAIMLAWVLLTAPR
jgi:hypothetical protein